MVGEDKKEEIRKEAKQILGRFSKELGKVKIKEKSLKSKVGGFRKEGSGEEGDEDFREKMFANFRIKDSDSDRESKDLQDSRHAPKKEGDFIVAEKKKW